MNCDALLVNPRYQNISDINENIGVGYIAAYARAKGKKVEILDLNARGWTNEQAIDYIRHRSAAVIGVSILFQEGAKEALDLIGGLRRANVNSSIIIGGIYPTFEYRALLENHPEIDYVCLGEGEETFYDLVECVITGGDISKVSGIAYLERGEVKETPARKPVMDLDMLPFPSRDILPAMLNKKPYASIVSSRGCYGRCSFCSVSGFFSYIGARYRYRKPEKIVEEIEVLIRDYGVNKFTFDDANFIANGKRGKDRAAEFADIVMQKGLNIEYSIQCRADDVDVELFKTLKDSGLVRVYLGIESGSPAQLERYKKDLSVEDNLKALKTLAGMGIFVQMGFIMFDTYATVDDIVANQKFLTRVKQVSGPSLLGPIYPTSRLIPLSGSEYMETLKADGRLKGDYLGYYYDFDDKGVDMLYKSASAWSQLVSGSRRLLGRPDAPSEGFPANWNGVRIR